LGLTTRITALERSPWSDTIQEGSDRFYWRENGSLLRRMRLVAAISPGAGERNKSRSQSLAISGGDARD